MLQTYANASGQCIKLEKYSVIFSSNTAASQKQGILRTLGVQEVNRFESYLGLPTLVGRTKYHTFSYLKDRIWKKLQGWKGKMLSKAGKEILIKTIAQSIPTYTMTAFPILKSGCCWRVGNGQSILILGDKWIPNYSTNEPLNLVKDEVREATVAELIDQDLHA
nr:uncharacterized protein LOC112035851 [Quercus suber]